MHIEDVFRRQIPLVLELMQTSGGIEDHKTRQDHNKNLFEHLFLHKTLYVI